MTPNEIPSHVSDGKIFTIIFTKRTTGEVRVMHARRGVTSHLKGGELRYDPRLKNLMTVFDLDKLDYRCVPLEAVTELRHHGRVEKFDG